MEHTLSYDDGVKGWTSFYSFIPEMMIGMNNNFFSFKGGNLFVHNSDDVARNNFYGQQYNSSVTSVFNKDPQDNKLFKTIAIQGDDSWSANLHTDIQNTGFIQKDWFEKKEEAFFAFIRNSGTTPAANTEYILRSANGIGRSLTISGPQNATVISFRVNPYVAIGGIISVGDYVYYSLPPYTSPLLGGVVTAINVDVPNAVNEIVIDATLSGAVYPIPIQNPFILFLKNSVAESHGVLGHYCVFTLENNNTNKVELFMAQSEAMKSYP
ncbi:structural protein [Caudoviricetes sp.]|nr:structural protein [Caudoviricetes sp.]